MLQTVFYSFSNDELTNILLQTSGTTASLSTLLCIYWGYHLCGVISIIAIISSKFVKTKFKAHEKGIIAIQQIREIVQDTPKTLTSKQRSRVRRAVRFGSFYEGIVPLPEDWLRKAEYQWFLHTINAHKIKTIVFTLSKIEKIFLGNVANFPKDLSNFITSLNELERFYLLLAARGDNYQFKIIDLKKSKETEFDILYNFANQIRPVILFAKNQRRSVTKEGKKLEIGNFIQSTWQDETVKQAVSISGIAASIMLIGVFIFKIEITQAFLTWFTITFGSLSISVGISKRTKGNSKQQEKTY